jgi:hypothetical protein
MTKGPFLTESHEDSKRQAVFDDDGTCAWLYLYEPDSEDIAADAFVYNRIPAPSIKQAEAVLPNQPPAPARYASDTALCASPQDHEWTFLWSKNGQSVALCKDNNPVAFIRFAKKPGYSKNLKKKGPWGNIWSNKIFNKTFKA